MIILGIDPGTAIIGYAIIKTKRHKDQKQDRDEKPKVLDFGCIITNKSDHDGRRLQITYDQINALIKKYKPDLMSVEKLFFFKNLKTALPVSQARGVILLAAAQHHIPTEEFTPLQMKMTIAGYGRAEKEQVQEMTKQLLDLDGFDLKKKDRKKDDAFDALGIALCGFLKPHIS